MTQELNSSESRDELNEAVILSSSATEGCPSQQQSSGSMKNKCYKFLDSDSARPKRTRPIGTIYQHSVKQSISRVGKEIEKSIVKTQSPKKKERRHLNQEGSSISKDKPMPRTASVSKLKKRRIMSLNDAVCSICLNPPNKQTAKLPCQHLFCLECIQFWAQSSSKCPYCRKQYDKMTRNNGEVITVEPKQPVFENSDDYIEDPCYVCGTFENIPMLLLCDLCENRCCHINCDPRIVRQIPDEWICAFCEVANLETQVMNEPPTIEANPDHSEEQSASQKYDSELKGRYNLRQRLHVQIRNSNNDKNSSNKRVNGIAGRTRSKEERDPPQSGDPLSRRMMRTRNQYRRRRNL